MYINHIKVNNFQSLKDLSLELAPFTVIVGPSSSGKSALTRALKTLTQNRRGTDFITHGEKTCTIQAQLTHGPVVTLSRSTATNENYYLLQQEPNTAPAKYTKLGGEVPPEISAALQVDPKATLNFAGQFDKPYLLDDSPAEAARELGSLTNVQVIFEAARESNRTKLSTGQQLKIRQTDLEDARTALMSYENLVSRRQALTGISQGIAQAQGLTQRLDLATETKERLLQVATIIRSTVIDTQPLPSVELAQGLVSRLELARTTYQRLVATAQTIRDTVKTLADIPDSFEAETLQERLNLAVSTRTALDEATEKYAQATTIQDRAQREIAALNEDYDQTLRELGTCPLCGQDTTHSHTTA